MEGAKRIRAGFQCFYRCTLHGGDGKAEREGGEKGSGRRGEKKTMGKGKRRNQTAAAKGGCFSGAIDIVHHPHRRPLNSFFPSFLPFLYIRPRSPWIGGSSSPFQAYGIAVSLSLSLSLFSHRCSILSPFLPARQRHPSLSSPPAGAAAPQ